MGRHSVYTDEIASEICNRLCEGEPLRQICRDEHMPAWRTVYDWQKSRPEFAAHIARARELGRDAIAEDTLEMIDAQPERIQTERDARVDPGYVQWVKNRVEQRMKLLAKWDPKRYGERVQLAGDPESPLTIRKASDLSDEELVKIIEAQKAK